MRIPLIAVSAWAVAIVVLSHALVTAFMGIYLGPTVKNREPQNCLLVGLFLVVFALHTSPLSLFCPTET